MRSHTGSDHRKEAGGPNAASRQFGPGLAGVPSRRQRQSVADRHARCRVILAGRAGRSGQTSQQNQSASGFRRSGLVSACKTRPSAVASVAVLPVCREIHHAACPVRYPVPQTQFSPSGPPSTRPEDVPPKIIWISRFRSGIACLRGCQKLSATALGPVCKDSGAGPRQIKSGARCARQTEAISAASAASRAAPERQDLILVCLCAHPNLSLRLYRQDVGRQRHRECFARHSAGP